MAVSDRVSRALATRSGLPKQHSTGWVPSALPTVTGGRKGWPWTEGSITRNVAGGTPRISVVVPSYNQAQYLEETLRSILLQNYPALELFVIDGGSTDGSVAVINKYSEYLSGWVSEPDRGQSDAINKGFKMSTGDWVAWQNSDDTYMADTFWSLFDNIQRYPEADVFYGITQLTASDNCGGVLASVHPEFNLDDMIPLPFVFNQSTFFSRRIFEKGIYLDADKLHLMDYEFIWRLALSGWRFQFAQRVGGNFRQQPLSKTASPSHSAIGCREFVEIYQGLYADKRFPLALRPRVVDGLRGQIFNAWANRRYDDLRNDWSKLLRVSGITSLDANVTVLRLLTALPSRLIEVLRRMFRALERDS